jgi:hypothetical protein
LRHKERSQNRSLRTIKGPPKILAGKLRFKDER